VKLFDRSGHLPVLTDQGRALLADARVVAGDVDLLKARAKSLAGGLEPELSVAVDVMFPDATFTSAVAAFQKEFPATLLRFDIESSAVIEPVLDGRCTIGIVGSWALTPPQLTHEPLLTISLHTVVAAQHPLAAHRGQIPLTILAEHIQITHIDFSDISGGYEPRLKIPRVWRLSHLGAKLAFLRAGFGFGALPLPTIEADLARGTLVEITTEDAPHGGRLIEMWAVYRTDSPPGPAGRWFIDRLKQAQGPPLKREPSRSQPASVAAKAARRRPSSRLSASRRKRSR
jgi:DNA-binding transcriptional LysR family regulator